MENKTIIALTYSVLKVHKIILIFHPVFFFLPLFTKKLNNFVSFPGSADNPE